jgi:hypothetical protein
LKLTPELQREDFGHLQPGATSTDTASTNILCAGSPDAEEWQLEKQACTASMYTLTMSALSTTKTTEIILFTSDKYKI